MLEGNHFESYFFWEGSFMIFVTEPTERDSDLTSNDIAAQLDDKVDFLRVDDRVISVNAREDHRERLSCKGYRLLPDAL